MTEKEIAMTIVLKMLDKDVILLEKSTSDTKDNNQKRVEAVCDAYKTVYQTVKQTN